MFEHNSWKSVRTMMISFQIFAHYCDWFSEGLKFWWTVGIFGMLLYDQYEWSSKKKFEKIKLLPPFSLRNKKKNSKKF